MSNSQEKLDPAIQRVSLAEFRPNGSGNGKPLLKGQLDVIKNVAVRLEVVVGEAEITVGELMQLSKDSVVKLEQGLEEPLRILLDGQEIGQGELVVADDHFGIRITQISTLE